jgi:hypothetical protein
MIKLQAPIELKTRTDFVKDNEGFTERIAGNYSLMGLEIGAEELLHIVNSPPEIYVAEGDATTIVGNTLISNRNEEKLDIINNMLNRIMLSVNTGLSYQDRVYITDVLHKIGIKDDRKFMSEVKKMMRNSGMEEKFIDNYLEVQYESDNTELIRETLELSRQIVREELQDRSAAGESYLYRSIMHRLQTGAIYQIVANFNKSINDTRIDLAQQMVSEQENIAKDMLVQSFIETMEREGAEIVYREGELHSPESEEGGAAAEVRTESVSEIRRETARQVLSEVESSIRESRELERTDRYEREGAEIIYREEAKEAGTEGAATVSERRIRESREYRSSNIYERELQSERIRESEVNETINAAVLYDIVKNLYHAGYERISRSYTWMEYRGALYHSSDNTVNRVSYEITIDSPINRFTQNEAGDILINLDYTEFEELSQIQENEGNIELIENQIKEMNEMNLANVSRYEQMTKILKKLTPEHRTTGGKERTRREALAALEDEKSILQSFEEDDADQEMRRREVFTEITRLFPDNAAQVFNVVEQYLNNPSSVQGMTVSAGNVAQAAEELMRMQQSSALNVQQENIPTSPPAEEELYFKREERLSEEDLSEILDTYRSRENRQHRDTSEVQDITENINVNTTTVTQNTSRTLTATERQNIEDMVARGVRSQMGAISDQVLSKLEKRLRNEKSRRGI